MVIATKPDQLQYMQSITEIGNMSHAYSYVIMVCLPPTAVISNDNILDKSSSALLCSSVEIFRAGAKASLT